MRLNKRLLNSALLLILFPGTNLQAQSEHEEGEVLAQVSRCYTCHHLTKALIGPSYQAIAARHGPRKELMLDVLTEKIILGGGGNWGLVPMVPNEHVSHAEARIIARWILAGED